MALPLRSAAALLVGAGGAGAVTMLPLLLTDASAAPTAARLGATAFALLLSVPIALGLTSLLKSGARREARNLAVFGALFWLGGLGSDLFNPAASGALLVGAHAAGLLGGVALAGAGAWALRAHPARG